MPRPRTLDADVRARLLEAASETIATDGPAALSLRDVARRAGTSTTAVYALFGNRDRLVEAVGEEAFRRFAARLAQAGTTQDPAADLLALGLAYRAHALAEPHFYRVMFDVPGTGARASSSPGVVEREPFIVLRLAVARTLRAQGRPTTTAPTVAAALWAHVHGLVSLELAGLLPVPPADREAFVRNSLRAAGAAALGPLPGAGSVPAAQDDIPPGAP